VEEKIYGQSAQLDEQGIERVKHLIGLLGSKSGTEREAARKELVKYRTLATPNLVEALKSEDHFVRWESAKALGMLADPTAAVALVETLMDDDTGVRWLASEALIALGDAAMEPLLRGMIDYPDSIWFQQGSYHILHVFERENILDPSSQKVLDALRSIEPEVTIPWLAESALEKRVKNAT